MQPHISRRPAPMTGETAQSVVNTMRDQTSEASQKAMLRLALGPHGNLGRIARQIYAARLAYLNGDADAGQ